MKETDKGERQIGDSGKDPFYMKVQKAKVQNPPSFNSGKERKRMKARDLQMWAGLKSSDVDEGDEDVSVTLRRSTCK